MAKNKGKRGFFFTIMALAILTFMLMTMQIWVQAFEQSDSRASQRFKGDSMRLVLTSLSDQSLNEFVNASAFYSIYRLANYTNRIGLADDLPGPSDNAGTGRVNRTIKELMLSGESSPDDSMPLVYSPAQKATYTINAWQSRIVEAALLTGFNVSFSNVSGFDVRQVDPWTVNVRLSMSMNVSDLEGSMLQSKVLRADTNISLYGLQDPAITRNDRLLRCGGSDCEVAEKQVFIHPSYRNASDVLPEKKVDGTDGAGWFFGPVTESYPEDIPEYEWGRLVTYALVHAADENITTYKDVYGAFVVTNQPTEIIYNFTKDGCFVMVAEQKDCINCRIRYLNGSSCGYEDHINESTRVDKPFIVTSGTDWLLSVPLVNRSNLPPPQDSQRSILIDNEYSRLEFGQDGYHSIYDVTKIRDMAICGFYVQGPGPSFFQRMLSNSYSTTYHNDRLGIETFVVGKWAGGALDQDNDELSRLDHEYYATVSPPLVHKIKSMPGCKDVAMCDPSSTNATTESVGKFRLSEDAIARYGLSSIRCDINHAASCNIGG